MRVIQLFVGLLAWFISLTGPVAQEKRTPPAHKARPFLRAESDFSGLPVKLARNLIITPQGDELDAWIKQCDSVLKTGGKIRVAHLGDSHIQADHFSGRMRELLQYSFGNGGRGLVFPYRVAKTNTPENYKLAYGGVWRNCKNVSYFKLCDLGVSGIVASSSDTAAFFSINPTTNAWLNYSFSRAYVFTKNVAGQMDFVLKKDSLTSLPYTANVLDSTCTEVRFDGYQPSFYLTLNQKDTNQKDFNFYGVSLENDSDGLLYHMAGINGAEYFSLLRCNMLEAHLKHLSPQLIIISLGTNEGFNPFYNDEDFKENAMLVIDRIRNANPGVSILLTMPGESLRKKRYPIQKHIAIRKVLYDVAIEKHCAIWDMYEVMGGAGSMKRWHAHKLTARDLVHYNAAGYRLQGELLYQALMNLYESKKSLK